MASGKSLKGARLVCKVSFSLEDADGKEMDPGQLGAALIPLLRPLLDSIGAPERASPALSGLPAAKSKGARLTKDAAGDPSGGLLVEGELWITPMEAAKRLLPSGTKANHRSRATILLRLAQKGELSKRQGEKIRPVYLRWADIEDYYAKRLPVIPAVKLPPRP